MPYPHRYQNLLLCSEFEDVDDLLLESAVKKWSNKNQRNVTSSDMTSTDPLSVDMYMIRDAFIEVPSVIDFTTDESDPPIEIDFMVVGK